MIGSIVRVTALLRTALGKLQWLIALVSVLIAGGCSRSPLTTSATSADSAVAQSPAAGPVEHQIEGQPVTAILRLAQGVISPGDQVELAVELKIAPTWEIHALDAQPASAATQLELALPPGIVATDDWQAPPAGPSSAPHGSPVYLSRVIFTCTLAAESSAQLGVSEIACDVGYQACTNRQCLQPQRTRLKVPLEIKNR